MKLIPALLLSLLLLCSTSSAWASERILALSPHACEMLYAIGAGDEIVGAVDYCDYPEAATHLPRIGSYTGINLEAALRLKPTLAVISGTSNQQNQMQALGIRVFRSAPQSVLEVLADIRRLGALSGHAEQAQALAANMQQRLDKLSKRRGNQPIKVFYEVWHDPLQTVGGTGFINDILKRAGLKNVFASIRLETPRINIESVLSADPDVIIIPSEHRDVAARKRFWKQWLGDGIRFIVVNPDLMHRPGPRIIDGIEALQKALEAQLEQAIQ
ncbi:MAG: cobalamin-binding protein [Mariprofundus sp.]|nr:cobalamin-binding protein [Mariprofundus sp.]